MRIPQPLARLVARAKPAVPATLWPLLLTMRSFPGGGPIVGVPGFRRVLVLAPHPDDETIGCGGTVALLGAAGADVTVVFATDGEATRGSPDGARATGARRREEAAQAAAILGAATRFLGLADGGLGAAVESDGLRDGALTAAIAAAVEAVAPEVVFAPWPLDGHPDHAAVAEALALVTARYGRPAGRLLAHAEVWGYETRTALVPNRLVDVSTVIDAKRAALAAHATGSLAFDLEAGIGLNRWRSVHGLMGRGYAEAFLAVPADDYAYLNRMVQERS